MFNSSLVKDLKSVTRIVNSLNDCELSLNTDTRSFEKGQSFLAIKGDRFDGFKFANEVLEIGTPLFFYNSTKENDTFVDSVKDNYENTCFVGCNDSLKTLQELGRLNREAFQERGGLVIGLTGSNGKTTSKEMMYFLLDSAFPGEVMKTKGNLNNHIGVPLTLLSIESTHKIAIVEMGTNHPGEIGYLCELSGPEAGLITSIGRAHIEFFKSVDNILKEKTALLRYIKDNPKNRSKFLLNMYDSKLAPMEPFENCLSFGTEDYHYEYDQQNVYLTFQEHQYTFDNPNIHETYNILNLVCAMTLCLSLYPEQEDAFLTAAMTFKMPSLNRSEWLEKDGKNIFLDAYNANPSSMSAALNSFVERLNSQNVSLDKALFILGDMNELGEFAEQEHLQIARELQALGIRNVRFLGRYSEYYGKGHNEGQCFGGLESYRENWEKDFKNYDYFFLKASRSLQLESIIDIK